MPRPTPHERLAQPLMAMPAKPRGALLLEAGTESLMTAVGFGGVGYHSLSCPPFFFFILQGSGAFGRRPTRQSDNVFFFPPPFGFDLELAAD